jgi:hypothetical protein
MDEDGAFGAGAGTARRRRFLTCRNLLYARCKIPVVIELIYGRSDCGTSCVADAFALHQLAPHFVPPLWFMNSYIM